MEDLNRAVLLAALLLVVWVAAPAVVAARKGYPPALWAFACGVVGVAVLAAFPPNPLAGGWTYDGSRLRGLADRVGAYLSLAQLAGLLGACLVWQ